MGGEERFVVQPAFQQCFLKLYNQRGQLQPTHFLHDICAPVRHAQQCVGTDQDIEDSVLPFFVELFLFKKVNSFIFVPLLIRLLLITDLCIIMLADMTHYADDSKVLAPFNCFPQISF